MSLRSTIVDLLAYGAVTGLVHSVNFYRRLRERERRALFLESNLANARLNMLKAQLQPHFLFNSLNAITALLRRDPRLAETTLVALSELLRLALSQSERQEGALREELEFVQRYLEIQQTRFGDKLRVEQDSRACWVTTIRRRARRSGWTADRRYGLVLGQDSSGARWTVVVDDVPLVVVAIASWDCGMEYDLSPDEPRSWADTARLAARARRRRARCAGAARPRSRARRRPAADAAGHIHLGIRPAAAGRR